MEALEQRCTSSLAIIPTRQNIRIRVVDGGIIVGGLPTVLWRR